MIMKKSTDDAYISWWFEGGKSKIICLAGFGGFWGELWRVSSPRPGNSANADSQSSTVNRGGASPPALDRPSSPQKQGKSLKIGGGVISNLGKFAVSPNIPNLHTHNPTPSSKLGGLRGSGGFRGEKPKSLKIWLPKFP